MRVPRAQLRQALIAAGAQSGTWAQPGTAETLAAVALAASGVQGEADCDTTDGLRVTVFQIETRPADTGRRTPRDREWLTDGLSNACLAAVALTHMNGLKMWPEYTSGAYRRYLPEAHPPSIQRPEDDVPYQEAPVFPGVPLRLLMRACGWIAPSNVDADRIAGINGFPSAADVPAGHVVRIPVQRGW
jgi:hypothetical protein